jgi:hypothetical protein
MDINIDPKDIKREVYADEILDEKSHIDYKQKKQMVKDGQLKISRAVGKIYRIIRTKHGTVFSLVDICFVFKTSAPPKAVSRSSACFTRFYLIII